MSEFTVNPVLVATIIKQATCIKQASIQFPQKAITLNFCVLAVHVLYQSALYTYTLECVYVSPQYVVTMMHVSCMIWSVGLLLK